MEIIQEIGFRILLCVISLSVLIGALKKAEFNGQLDEVAELIDEGMTYLNRVFGDKQGNFADSSPAS
ncbi:MAG: hypothetical protein ACKO81_04395 [Planctomycetota bacterium]